jgi:hypothetical protein
MAKDIPTRVKKIVWPRRDSNTQPSDLESDALPLRHGVTHRNITFHITITSRKYPFCLLAIIKLYLWHDFYGPHLAVRYSTKYQHRFSSTAMITRSKCFFPASNLNVFRDVQDRKMVHSVLKGTILNKRIE